MADGIQINSGLSDLDLNPDLLDGTVKGVLFDFASKMQTALRDSVDKKKLLYTAELSQALAVEPNIIETEEFIFYKLEVPRHGVYQNEGVSGTERTYSGSRFGFKQSSKPPFGAMVKWAESKFGLSIPQGMTAKQFGFAAAYNKKRFGIKPTYWLDEVVNDGRVEELENELGKRIGFFIAEQF